MAAGPPPQREARRRASRPCAHAPAARSRVIIETRDGVSDDLADSLVSRSGGPGAAWRAARPGRRHSGHRARPRSPGSPHSRLTPRPPCPRHDGADRAAPSARPGCATNLGSRRHRRRRRDHRLGRRRWHDDLGSRRRVVARVRRLRRLPAGRRTTTTATARTSPASSPATATTPTAPRAASRPART